MVLAGGSLHRPLVHSVHAAGLSAHRRALTLAAANAAWHSSARLTWWRTAGPLSRNPRSHSVTRPLRQWAVLALSWMRYLVSFDHAASVLVDLGKSPVDRDLKFGRVNVPVLIS